MPLESGGLLPNRPPGTDVFSRGSLALANLVRLDPENAIRAVLSPGSLSPGAARTTADELSLEKGGITEFVVNSLTNPFVLAGIVLSMRYPIPLAKEMFRFSKQVAGIDKKAGLLQRTLGNIDEIFVGTDVPDNYNKLLQTVSKFKVEKSQKLGAAVLKAKRAGLEFDRRTQVLVSAKLDGLDKGKKAILKPIREGKVFDTLVDDIRVVLDETYDDLFGSEASRVLLKSKAIRKSLSTSERKAIDKALKAGKDGVSGLSAAHRRRINSFMRQNHIGDVERFSKVDKLENYFPHRVPLTARDYDEETRQLLEMAGLRRGTAAKQALAATETQTTSSALARRHKMLADPEDLEVIKDFLKKEETLDDYRKAMALGRVKPYSLKASEVLTAHTHSTGKAFGWTVTQGVKGRPLGEEIADAALQFQARGDVRATMLTDSYIPLALGRKTFNQAMRAAAFADDKIRLTNAMNGPLMKKLIPEDIRKWATQKMAKEGGLFSTQNLNARAAGYFYGTTLGANPVSASYNLMQLLLTTVPTIGPRATMNGINSLFKRAPKYFKARSAGIGHEAAIQKAFPEYVESGLGTVSVLEDATLQELNNAWKVAGAAPGVISKTLDRGQQALMGLFQASENVVRLTTFEGARLKAASEGLKLGDQLDFARKVTQRTQFLGGPANIPHAFINAPPLVRQFATFSSRTAGFLTQGATQFGSAAQSGLGGRNFGTLGRALATSGLAFEAGKSFLDRDLSHGLIFGALPAPHPDAPFSPFPFVPPAFSIAGSAAQDLLSGEFEKTPRTLPLLVPGGLALSRLSTRFSPEVAETVGRGYADYDQKLPDGRIPMYTASGSFRGYFSSMQVWSETLGVAGGAGSGQTERELQGWLLGQRDRIRGYRREFLDSVAINDTRKAHQINQEFKKEYPFMPGLHFTERDRRAVELRKAVPRLERILETLPAEARPQFAEVITTALAQETQDLLGVDPYLLQELPTTASRSLYRPQRPTNFLERALAIKRARRQTPSLGTGPRGEGPQQRAGRRRRFESLSGGGSIGGRQGLGSFGLQSR